MFKIIINFVDTKSMTNIDLEPEILINASEVSDEGNSVTFEFVLDQKLSVIECVKVACSYKGTVDVIQNPAFSLDGILFELNHVRVNPKVDNTLIVNKLTNELENIGVQVLTPIKSSKFESNFKPLGEISDNVRFYINHYSNLIFLSPSVRPKLVIKQ